MEMEPLQLIRGMDVDIGMGLGDDLGGFEGFDAIFAEPSNTTDFFKCCALEDAQEQEDAATTSAFHGPPSPVTTFGQQQKGHDFALESWNTGGQEQVQAWLTTGLSTSEPCTRNPNALLHSSSMHSSGAKPRARKRHDEDEALEAEGSTFPLIKRRSSTASIAPSSLALAPAAEGLEKSHSFCVTTSSGRWTPAAPGQQNAARRGGEQQGGGMSSPPPPGGAIKVNTDVMSGTMRPPRISVFMSSSRRRGTDSPAASPVIPHTTAPQPPSSMVPTSALPGSYGAQHQLEPTMDRTASAQAHRLKDLRITMRAARGGRSMAEKYVVEHTPAVVAMGSPHLSSTSPPFLLGEDGRQDRHAAAAAAAAAPTLRRASSVGALTIAGNGEIHSTSPVLSATGRIIQSCELSDRVGDGGQRRNLVCKVFGSGGRSPYMGPTNGGR